MIFLIGASGTGKSLLIKKLSTKLNALDMDLIINHKLNYGRVNAKNLLNEIINKNYDIISCPVSIPFITSLNNLRYTHSKNFEIINLVYLSIDLWEQRLRLPASLDQRVREDSEVKSIIKSNINNLLINFENPLIYIDNLHIDHLVKIIINIHNFRKE